MATVSSFGVSLCLVFVLFTQVVEGQSEDERAGYLDAWWFIWMSVLLCLICGCGGGASYYRRRVWQQQQVAALRYQQQRYPIVCPRTCERGRRDPVYVVDVGPSLAYVYPHDVTNGPPRASQPMTAPVKPPPYQPRDDDNPLGAPPAYQDAVQMQPAQPTVPEQTHWQQQNQQSDCPRA